MINVMVMEFSSGQMGDSMRANGLKVNSMVLEFIEIRVEKLERESGLKEKE